jgi:twinkle protein
MDSEQVAKLDCPDCGGGRSMGAYSDGHTYCFKCGTRTDDSEVARAVPPEARRQIEDAIPLDAITYVPLAKRKLGIETMKKWRYGISENLQVANYFSDDGTTLLAQKLRSPDKAMWWRGDSTNVGLYGKWLWPKGGKRVIVTEGEIDALTVSQLQDNKWPVVSIPHGAQTAVKAIKRDLEWLLSFETVVLAFDMDEQGQDAARKCAEVFPLGKVKVAKMPSPYKDANDVWVAGKVQELTSALWNADEFKLDGIVTAKEMAPSLLLKPVVGAPWKWEGLTKLTYGRRDGELFGFGAATGGGKTDFFTEQVEYDVCTLGEPTGLLFLEQQPQETLRRIMGKLLSKRLHIPGMATDEDLAKAAELATDLPLYLFNHFGQIDWPTVKARIIFMVKSLGCRSIYLDHLTALVAGVEDENKELQKIMAELAGLGVEMGHRLHYISHLATPEGKPHEEGGRVMMRHFRGSRAIGFWTHFAFGLERDQQAEDKDTRLTTTLRCIKDRNTGNATGEVLFFKYDPETGRQHETDRGPAPAAPDARGFRDHSKPGAPPDY